MSVTVPQAHFFNSMLVFGSLERGSSVAKGFWVQPADVRGASHLRLNENQDRWRTVLQGTGPGRRLQFQWSCDSNYREELERYRKATEAVPEPAIRTVREERFARYWQRVGQRGLRRERLAVFLSIEVQEYSGNLASKEQIASRYESLLAQCAREFAEFVESARRIFGVEANITPMDDADHGRFTENFLNPSIAAREARSSPWEPARSIQQNCWHGEVVGQRDGSFFMDGHHHAVLALKRWPQRTRPGIVTHLTGLPFLDYSITVNVTPALAGGEIAREEKAVERLKGEYQDRRRHSLLVALRKKERKIENLAGGFARPFFVTYVIRAWDRNRDGLMDKIAALKAAIHAMDGAQYWDCALPATTRNLFLSTWPGWLHSGYRHRELYAEDTYLADLVPSSATFVGHLEDAEAIYDGNQGNLVGVNTFIGGSPQHTVLFGITGAGKSEFLRDLLLQTAGNYVYTVIVEEGLSHRRFTETLGETPIVVHPDAPLTLNYLDTRGLPLTQFQITSAVALLSRLIGEADTAEALALRQAQLTHYLLQAYLETFAQWSHCYPDRATEVRRLACAAHLWRARLPIGTAPIEAFIDLRDRLGRREDQALTFFAGIRDEQVADFVRDPATAPVVAHTACAFYQPDEFPTHSRLVETLTSSRLPEHSAQEIGRLASLLRAWCAHGQYGRLFDGTTNVSLQGKVAHFELGLIPEHATALKAAAGLLVSGFARQHILTLPREQRKRVVFEEVARLHDVPGGEQLISEGYAQLRKFNCWVVSVVQQYAMFQRSRIRAAVMGNAKQFLLMRQHDRADLADIARDLALPESAVEAIQRYPLPEQLAHDSRHSSLCYLAPTCQPPLCGTIRHFQPHETTPAR